MKIYLGRGGRRSGVDLKKKFFEVAEGGCKARRTREGKIRKRSEWWNEEIMRALQKKYRGGQEERGLVECK